MDTNSLLTRLDEIGRSSHKVDTPWPCFALAWLARSLPFHIDAYSDLDFFVIVEQGYKLNYIQFPPVAE